MILLNSITRKMRAITGFNSLMTFKASPSIVRSTLLLATLLTLPVAVLLVQEALRNHTKVQSPNFYYVAPSGSGISCNQSNPCSLETANSKVQAGYTVFLYGGLYNTAINPSNSGSENNFITYQSISGETPVIATRSDIREDYIVIKGLTFDSSKHGSINIKGVTGTHHVQILNSQFADYPHDNTSVIIEGDYYTIRDCFFGKAWGDMIMIRGAHTLIEYNDFSQSGADHSLIAIRQDAPYTVVRRNVFRNPWDRIMIVLRRENFITPERILVEENVFFDTLWDGQTPLPKDADGGNEVVRFVGSKNIFRNNLIIGNRKARGNSSVAAFQFYLQSDRYFAEHLRIYHNTIYRNATNAIYFRRTSKNYVVNDNIFKNNIIAESGSYEFKIGEMGFEYIFDNNIISNSQKSNTLYIGPSGGSQSISTAQNNHPENFVNNITSNPQFRNESILDDAISQPSHYGINKLEDFFSAFLLRSGSPGINNAIALTKVTSSGSSTIVKVDDALYFSDGNGVISGDKIVIGSSGPVIITQVIDEKTLSVDRTISVSAGDEVFLEKSSESPDMGIYPLSSRNEPYPIYAPIPTATQAPTPIPTSTASPIPTPVLSDVNGDYQVSGSDFVIWLTLWSKYFWFKQWRVWWK